MKPTISTKRDDELRNQDESGATNGTPRARLPHHVLVAVDSESASDSAIDAALELARRFDARIEFVHAFRNTAFGAQYVEDPRKVSLGADMATTVGRFATEHVRAVLAASKSTLQAEEILRVVPGVPAHVVLDRAREVGADLIVLGALRSRPIVDFGSTARAILAKASCPVLVQPGPRRAIRTILVPVDMSTESKLALATACAWAATLSARVVALHCFDSSIAVASTSWSGMVAPDVLDDLAEESRLAFERDMSSFDWNGAEHATEFVEGTPVQCIQDRAETADMIAMGTHGRTGFAAALLGSVAYSVLKHATKPVLVVRDPRRAYSS